MADYYTNFSVVLPLNKQQQEYALQLAREVEARRYEEQPLPGTFPGELVDEVENWTFQRESTPDGLWLYSQYGGQDAACAFIQHLLRKFEFAPAVTFEWSHDCSKPRTDAFGGGAAFITAHDIKTMHTSEWLRSVAA